MTNTASVDKVARLIEEHRLQMERLTQAHADRLSEAQTQFDEMVLKANADLQALVSGSQPDEEIQKPQAIWSDGFLVLNKAAADSIDALFTQMRETFEELSNIITSKPR